MNAKYFLLVLGLSIAAACSATPPQQHAFAIYLASNLDKRIIHRDTGDWSEAKLSESAVISDADILSYDFTSHSMVLKPEALARIPRPPVAGTPFVVVVNGQRVYVGAFTTCLSSFSFAVPSITVDRQLMDTNQPANALIIERAYPSPPFGVGTDPRSDRRIRDAFAAVQKLNAGNQVFDDKLTKEVGDILKECTSITRGMTRAELLWVFTTEGGLSTAKGRRFVHRRCPYIKVDVEFNLSEPNQSVVDERPTDTISRISQPYLQWSIMD